MKKSICMKRVKEVADSMSLSIIRECDRLFRSGGIDTSSFSDQEYVLPKILLIVALENTASGYRPPGDSYKKQIANLRHF